MFHFTYLWQIVAAVSLAFNESNKKQIGTVDDGEKCDHQKETKQVYFLDLYPLF